jgi:hypothetical protein
LAETLCAISYICLARLKQCGGGGIFLAKRIESYTHKVFTFFRADRASVVFGDFWCWMVWILPMIGKTLRWTAPTQGAAYEAVAVLKEILLQKDYR